MHPTESQRECAGGYVPPGLSRQPDGFRGIVLPNPVKKGDTVLNVPRKCAFLTSDAAQLLRDEGYDNLASRRHAQVLVLGAMVARQQKAHFLAPYFDTWPVDTSNFPTNWPADEVKRLPEAYRNRVETYKKHNRDEWRAVGAAAPDFVKRYSYAFFVETEALVSSRYFGVDWRGHGHEGALIPVGDAPNHASRNEGLVCGGVGTLWRVDGVGGITTRFAGHRERHVSRHTGLFV